MAEPAKTEAMIERVPKTHDVEWQQRTADLVVSDAVAAGFEENSVALQLAVMTNPWVETAPDSLLQMKPAELINLLGAAVRVGIELQAQDRIES